MKTKLIKINDIYTLLGEDNKMIASDDIDFQSDYKIGKLSKQNCDEIFGVVDDGKLAEEEIPYSSSTTINVQRMRFIHGFNKAMELNKDKLFTVEDMRTAMLNAIEMTDFQKEQFRKDNDYHIALDIIQSLQQPTEIEVEVVYQRFCCSDNFTCGNEDNCMICTRTFPKLDSNGCLILKKI
jgi:hypothetical protein